MLKKTARFHLFHLRGFTLVELLVSIAVLAALIAGVAISINPRAQIDKAQDAVRQQSIAEIKKGLEVYYSDKGCYPKSTGTEFATALSTGGQWGDTGTNTVYIKKVPKDPDGTPYTYLTDSADCPQWNVLFAKLKKPSTTTQACSLTSNNSCTPQGFDTSWACAVSGSTAANCSTIQAFVIATPTAVPTVGVPTNTPTPTPTSPVAFYVVMPPTEFPQFYQGTIDPPDQKVGNTQKLSVDVFVKSGTVSTVSATIKTDNKTQIYTMTKTGNNPLQSGISDDTNWSASWTVNDTTKKFFNATISGTDSLGNTSSFNVILN